MKKSRVIEKTESRQADIGLVITSHGTYRTGCAFTLCGIVAIYDQKGDLPHTRLDVVIGFRCYTRTIARTFTDRGLLIVAGRFASEIYHQVRRAGEL